MNTSNDTVVHRRWIVKATICIFLAAFGLLLVLIARSPEQFLYDEPCFVNYIPLLHKYGFSVDFLNSLTGTVGPLYAFVHVAFEPVTRLQPVGMRSVNFLLLAGTATILGFCWHRRFCWDYWLVSGSVLVIPMTWVVSGMALSEMPAILFVAIGTYLLLRAIDRLEAGHPVTSWFLSAAVCIGVATWGRQPYLLLAAVPILLSLQDRRLIRPAAIAAVTILGLAAPLFFTWKGLVPPSHHSVQQGVSIVHGLLSFGYAGVCLLLLGSRITWLPPKTTVALFVLTVTANLAVGSLELYPIRSFTARFFPETWFTLYGRLCGSLFLSVGAMFLIILLRTMWQERTDLRLLVIYGGLSLVVASAAFVAHQYSSRYTAMALPHLVLAAHAKRIWGGRSFVLAALGCSLGFLSLLGYFRS